jgi:hypothetical protein
MASIGLPIPGSYHSSSPTTDSRNIPIPSPSEHSIHNRRRSESSLSSGSNSLYNNSIEGTEGRSFNRVSAKFDDLRNRYGGSGKSQKSNEKLDFHRRSFQLPTEHQLHSLNRGNNNNLNDDKAYGYTTEAQYSRSLDCNYQDSMGMAGYEGSRKPFNKESQVTRTTVQHSYQ